MSDKIDPMANSENPFTQQELYPSAVVLRPTGVTVTGVLCCIGGGLGLLMSFVLVAQLLFGQALGSAMIPPGPAGDAQRSMHEDIAKTNERFFVPNIGAAVINSALAVGLLVGGIALFMTRPWAPRWVRRCLLAIIIMEILRLGLYILMQVELYSTLQGHMDRIADQATGSAGGMSAELVKSVQTVSMIFGYAIWGIWFLVKVALMLWGRSYLDREHVREFFSADPA